MDEQEQGIDVSRYIGVMLHWWWAIAIVVILLAGVAYAYSQAIKSTSYRTRATILIQESRSGIGPALGDIQTSQQLATTYRQLLRTRPLLERVIEELGLSQNVDTLRSQVDVSVRTGTPLLDVEVRGSDPDSPVIIANTLVEVFIQDRQTTRLAEIARLEALAAAQGTTDTRALVAAQFSTLGSMSIVERANEAEASITPSTRRNMLLAGFLGLFLGVVLVFFLDYSRACPINPLPAELVKE